MVERQKKVVRVLDVLGYKIESNSCSALEYNLYLKKFGEWVVRSGHEQGLVLTMNHIQIHELLDEATSVSIDEVKGKGVFLVIETTDYKVSFKIPVGEDN